MNRRHILSMPTIAALALALPLGSAFAQTKPLKDQLVGTWNLVSFESTSNDGSKKPVFGAQPLGILMLDTNGHYAMVLTDPGRPKWKSNLRTETTNEELATAAKGLIAQFGSWSVDEGTKTYTRKVEGALNPGLGGAEQKFTVALSGDELKVTDIATSGVTGGKTETMYRRAK
jgi:hypothetical protein